MGRAESRLVPVMTASPVGFGLRVVTIFSHPILHCQHLEWVDALLFAIAAVSVLLALRLAVPLWRKEEGPPREPARGPLFSTPTTRGAKDWKY